MNFKRSKVVAGIIRLCCSALNMENEPEFHFHAFHKFEFESLRCSRCESVNSRITLKSRREVWACKIGFLLTVLFPLFLTAHFSRADSFSSIVTFVPWLRSKYGPFVWSSLKLSVMKSFRIDEKNWDIKKSSLTREKKSLSIEKNWWIRYTAFFSYFYFFGKWRMEGRRKILFFIADSESVDYSGEGHFTSSVQSLLWNCRISSRFRESPITVVIEFASLSRRSSRLWSQFDEKKQENRDKDENCAIVRQSTTVQMGLNPSRIMSNNKRQRRAFPRQKISSEWNLHISILIKRPSV